MRTIVMLLALAGIIFVAVGYVQNNLQCPPPAIQYRYVTKTFDDEQNDQELILSVAGIDRMFEKDSPWIDARNLSGSNFSFKDR